MPVAHNGYAAFLDLRGVSAVIAGGGPVAARKARTLLRAGARVTAVAPKFDRSWARLKGVRRLRRAFLPADLHGARLVFAATDKPKLNQGIARLARREGAWVNVAAPPEAGDLVVPACARRGRLCVAISTGGVSAAAAKALRRELERNLGAEWGTYLALLEARRARIIARVPDPRSRRKLLQRLGDPKWVGSIRRRGRAAAARRMDALIAKAEVVRCSRSRF